MSEARTPSRSLSALSALALSALVASGCGSSVSGGSPPADPAMAVPASAALYIGAVIQPGGSLKANAVAAAARLTHLEHPYEQLLGALQSEGPTHITWSELKPWVGEEAGLFIDSLGTTHSALGLIEKGLSGGLGAPGAEAALGGQTQGALLLDISDAAKARAFLKSQAARAGAIPGASFDGVSYEVNAQQRAFAVVGKFAVIGSQSALRGVIETVQGHPSLLHSAAYSTLAGAGSGQALANAYLDPAALLSAGQAAGAAKARGLGLLSGILASAKPVYLSLTPSAGSISIETLSPQNAKAQSEREAGEQMFGQLPGDSWLALGIGDLGKTLEGSLQGFESLSSLASSSSGLGGLLPKVSTKGVNIKHDFLRWMGAAGVFAAGTSLVNIAAGVVIASTDPAASRAAVAKMARLLSGSGGSVTAVSLPGAETALAVHSANSPLTIDVAAGRGKFVIGLGEASIEQALAPSSTLSGSPAYSTAQAALRAGLNPNFMVEFPTLLGFMEGLNLQENPTLSKIVPYLRQLDTVTAGTGRAGSLTRSRLILTLR